MSSIDKEGTTVLELEHSYGAEQHHATVKDLREGAEHDGDEALKTLASAGGFQSYTQEEENKVRRKIDFRLVPLMLLINGIQFVDKQTISQAATYGLIKEANLKGQEFSLLISLFYIGYLLAQYPANLLMQRFPMGKVITISFVLWSIDLACMSTAKSFSSLAAARFFLGVFESCLNPGFVLITSTWWKREEQPARIGIWYAANGLSGIISGPIFYGIAHLQADNLFPYQWMFLFFGLFSLLFGISLWWLLPDSPLQCRWLNERERLIAIERLKSNKTGVRNTHHKKEQVKEALCDGRTWMMVAAVFCHNMTNSLQSNFTGLLLKGFGYTTFQAVLLSMPGGAIMAVASISVTAFLATKWGEGKRIFAIIICYFPGIIASAILYTVPLREDTKHVHLGAIFIISIVAVSAGILYSLLAANVAGYTKKTVSGSLFFMAYCVSNTISPQTFLADQAPKYQTGVGVTLAAFSINIILFIVLYFWYRSENSKRDKSVEGAASQDENADLLDAFSDLTDRENKKMRYKL